MVYTDRAETAAVSSNSKHWFMTSFLEQFHVAPAIPTFQRPLYKKILKKKLFTHAESHASTGSLLDNGE